VTFHDGAAFTADAVIWNFRRIYDDKSPQYAAPAAPIVRAAVSMVDTFEKADDDTIVLTTKYPFSFLPWLLTRVLMVSPAQWDKVGRSWAEFAKQPAGTGAFKITKVVPGQYAEMSRNGAYWDKERIPRVDKMVVYPMAEATTRVAALRSGQVDWIEVPAPDSIPSLISTSGALGGHRRPTKSRNAGAHFAASAPEARWPWSLSISKYVASTPALRKLSITPGARLGGNSASVRDSTYSTGTRIRARSGVTS
jgi:ABC-type transport system substrate-binding protein